MDRIIVENVRCFQGMQSVPIAPLTILVGENSTGKSTLLAMARLAWDIAATRRPQFNEDPFLLGAYDQIATLQGPRKPAKSFLIGCGSNLEDTFVSITGEFVSDRSQPVLKTWCFDAPPFRMEAELEPNERIVSLKVQAPSGIREIGSVDLEYLPAGRSLSLIDLYDYRPYRFASIEEATEFLRLLLDWEEQRGRRPYAFAPIRTRPLRTYDPIKEVADPEGGHVPMMLAGIRSRDKKSWQTLRKALDNFGKASGLFGKVDVRRLGTNESDPFQLQVLIDGSVVNLVDVGYGVSQILPILVDCIRGDQKATFLLQQPEVHLHPKAQAELGSFLGFLARNQEKRFLVETHSDYLVDRIRMDVRDRKNGLRPEDVSLLYFERQAGSVQIHQLVLDEFGNIKNAPPGYRSFFLEEERRFLGG
jgi:hypothetical protein